MPQNYSGSYLDEDGELVTERFQFANLGLGRVLLGVQTFTQQDLAYEDGVLMEEGLNENFMNPEFRVELQAQAVPEPAAMGSGEADREVQGFMAAVILDGLITPTLFSVFSLPPLILAFRNHSAPGAIEFQKT